MYICLLYILVLLVEFSSEQFTGSESSGFIEVLVRITGGTSTTPITVTVTLSVQSPASAMGNDILYLRTYVHGLHVLLN